ncbi:micronuclear linker histone polyprotein-like [Pempheris klunzingeri]|uniref:micronuclear linker histone polyprotein-like n=1 Tax=Pempheris klunzingeri TaxID=3127111 RepID=UPI00397F37B2
MNPIDWEAVQRLQRSLHPDQPSGVQNSMENGDWDTYCPNSRYTVDGPQSTMAADMGWKGPSPPPQHFYIKESEAEDSDGQPLEIDEEDAELTRKRKELKEIEEQILQKKVAIALKTVKPFVKETCDEQPATCEGATLKDRVNVILQQRHSSSCLTKVRSPKERLNTSSLSKEGLLQEDHWLKLRVKALMKQRCGDSCVLPTHREVPDVTPPPPSQSVTSPANEENSVDKGFQRFLSVLNKGVDIDLLSRIVTDDDVDLVNFQPPVSENKSDPPFRSESQPSTSVERKTDPPSQERLLPHDDDDDRGSRSKSPPAAKKKEEKPKVDEQHEHLQNILKTLGLSLGVEEMSKLADRTQERLYGKKHEDVKADSREKQESQQKASQKCRRSSSSSSSTSSRLSFSSSPSRHRRSHSRHSKRRRKSGSSGSRDRSRDGDGLTRRDSNQDGEETHRDGDKDRDDSNETSNYQHPYPQNRMYPHLHPAAFPVFPGYTSSQYSSYHSGTYSTDSNSYPSSSYPSGCPQQQSTSSYDYDYDFHCSAGAPVMIYPECVGLEDANLLVNPDLSKSEGQIGSTSGPRCLQVINTKPPPRSNLKLVKKCRKRRKKTETAKRKRKLVLKRRKELKRKVEPLENNEDDSENDESEEEKQLPTEEEIKANLRKKLEAFNQKVKQKHTQPANSLTPPTG